MLSDRPDAHTKPSATVYAQSPRALYCIYLYAPADAPPCTKTRNRPVKEPKWAHSLVNFVRIGVKDKLVINM